MIVDNAGQVHHFNPGGGVPAWLINRLAEGKPLAFVQRLEKVAAKWDGQAKTTKGVPYDGGGFGEHGIGWIGFSLAYSKMRVIPVLDIDDGIWYRCRWVERRANNTSNGEPHLEQGRLRLETWSNMTSRLLRRHGQHIYTYTYCTQCIPW